MINERKKITLSPRLWGYLQKMSDDYGVSKSMIIGMLLSSHRMQLETRTRIINDEIKSEL